ncbi:hypothetical protein H0H92_001413 [Tricholoma furcatifolium]|nr:hypothetical protein H0H92_001413 [Tricholoma furcatifolium]
MDEKLSCNEVLHCPELLSEIFLHSTKKSNLVNLQVCKLWRNIAEPIVWKELTTEEDLKRLLFTLAPFSFDDDETLQVPTSPPDWKYFLKHASMVHSLTVMQDDCITSALKFIANTRPIYDVLPNLHTLICDMDGSSEALSSYGLLFHPGLNKLVLKFDDDFEFEFFPFAMPLLRMDGLTCLEIHAEKLENPVTSLPALQFLPSLASISLPYLSWRCDVIQIVSTFPALRESRSSDTWYDFNSNFCRGDCDGGKGIEDMLLPSSFSDLTMLTISGCSHELGLILNHPYFPANINILRIELISRQQSINLQDLLTPVHRQCPDMEALNLDIVTNHPDELRLDFSHSENLRSLLSSKLTSLKLRCKWESQFTHAQLEELVRNIPSIETLILNPEPDCEVDDSVGCDSQALSIIATYCPNLRHCGILLKTSQFNDAQRPTPRFPFLQVLDVGDSYLDIDDGPMLAMFMTEALPATTQIIYHNDTEQAWNLLINMVTVCRRMLSIGELRAMGLSV